MSDFLFAQPAPPDACPDACPGAPQAAPAGEFPDAETGWPVLIVDDDEEVHAVTRLALRKVRFKNRRLQLTSAYSAREAEQILRESPRFAVILLDVVMETEDAGLQLCKKLREEMGVKATRVILRTGQPGQAPEERVILDYDINDYKSKTELTAQKLFTTVVAALRSYRDIVTIETNRRGLEKIIQASDHLMEMVSLSEFAEGALLQVCSLLEQKPEGVICLQKRDGAATILAGAGRFSSLARASLDTLEDPAIRQSIETAFKTHENVYRDDSTTIYLRAEDGNEVAALTMQRGGLSKDDRHLLEFFALKISAGFTNVLLYEKLLQANEQLRLANEALEQRVTERTAELQEANLQLKEMALTDFLTRVANRRRLFERGNKEVQRCERSGAPLAVILFDLDRFKLINDTYGHDAGDEVLRQVAHRAGLCLRSFDTLARQGGEEFCILLTETGLEGGRVVAERIREGFAQEPVRHALHAIPISASFGVVERQGEESFESMLKRADQALYAAKQHGRNRVELA